MTTKEIRHIFCAVLGKPTSRNTVTKAIDLALEHNARLTFVHVLNVNFLASATPSMTPLRSVYNQLRELGEFTMLILRDRAQRRGVTEVDHIIREGQILPQLRLITTEMRPDIFVIGKPTKPSPIKSSLPLEEINAFIVDLETNLDIQVVPVEIPPSA